MKSPAPPLVVASLFIATSLVRAQTPPGYEEKLQLVVDPVTPHTYEASFWGKTGRTYFIGHTDDLLGSWSYFPVAEYGQDAIIRYAFTNTAPKVFVHLRYFEETLADPFGLDSDGDGLTNQQEFALGTDPFSADSDGDGLPDDWEESFGLDPLSRAQPWDDFDGDSLADLSEYQAQTDPSRPHPGWSYIALPVGLTPLAISHNGVALLHDNANYYRWQDGELLTLSAYADYYAEPVSTSWYLNRSGDIALLTVTHSETEPEYPFFNDEWSIGVWQIWPKADQVAWTFTPPDVTTVSDFIDAVGYKTRNRTNTPSDVVMADDGSLWLVQPNRVVTDGYDGYVFESMRNDLAKIAAPGVMSVERVMGDDELFLNGVDGQGQIVGEVLDYTTYEWYGLVGSQGVSHLPRQVSRDGRTVARLSTGAWRVIEPTGTQSIFPAGNLDYVWDSQERLNTRQFSGGDELWRLWTQTGENRDWQGYDYELMPVPTDWTTSHRIAIGAESPQLATATINGQARAFVALPTPATLAVDANNNGIITLASESTDDRTHASLPFRFWSNDDDDSGPAEGDDIPGRPLNKADYNNAAVDSVRDLVDFFPVYLDIKQLLGVLPHTTAGITYKLKQADGALNFVYTNKTKAQAFDYQKQVLSTGFGPAFTQAAGVATTEQITAAGATLNTAFLDGVKNNDWGVILIEGRVATTAPLRLVVEKNGTEIAEVAVNIKISPVEEMFRHVNLTGTPKNYDNTNPSLPETPEATRTGTPANWPDTQTNGKYFVFLHGYNVDAQKARGWQAEVFKRLHALGSKARFVGVTWHGATGLDYHRAVFHAFQTGDALAGALSFTGNADVTIAAHSLGNMVVSHAIQAGGFTPARYYIINGATPLEAYGPNDADPGEAANMTELAWRTYDSRLYMANWHTLFPGTDNRSALTWKGLFQNVALTSGLAHNFYSEEEEVVADADLNTSASVVATLLNQGFNVSFGAWKAQELVKGVDWTTSIVSAFMIRGQAGWGFNTDWDVLDDPTGPPGQGGTPIRRRRTPAQTVAITHEELKTKPFFEEFLEAELMSANATTASNKAGETWVRYDLFARGIPAMSNATAANVMASLTNARNFPMHTAGKVAANGPFPTTPDGAWRHSDFKDVGLPYVYPMYQAMIDRGGLDQ